MLGGRGQGGGTARWVSAAGGGAADGAGGGEPVLRAGYTTDNGNQILDVRGLDFGEPEVLEEELNQLPGVVGNGVSARRGADCLLVAGEGGVWEMRRKMRLDEIKSLN